MRCDTISQLVEECTNKELDTIFITLVHDIFGITNQIGWNLRSIQYNTHAIEYELLFKFLHPHGPVFRLCYKLLTDCYRKYEYQLIYLPVSLIQYIYLYLIIGFNMYLSKYQMHLLSEKKASKFRCE